MRFETIFGRSGLSCKFRYPCLWCVVCDSLTPLSVFFQVWKCTLGTLVKLYVTFPSDAAHRRWIISFHISQLIPTSGWERTLLSFQMSENQLEVLFLRREMALKIWSNVSEVTGLQGRYFFLCFQIGVSVSQLVNPQLLYCRELLQKRVFFFGNFVI